MTVTGFGFRASWAYTLSFVLLLAVLPVFTSASWFTVYYDPETTLYSVKPGKDTLNGVATAEYSNEISATGWARLNLYSNPIYSDDIQMYGSGYLEGVITQELIWQNWVNTFENELGGKPLSPKLIKWFSENVAYMKQQVKAHAERDPYWRHVGLVLTQMEGIYAGYNHVANATRKLTYNAFFYLNSDGDMEDLAIVVNETSAALQTSKLPVKNTHCSSLVRVTYDLQEMFAGHTTWSPYYDMVRIFKYYDIPLRAPQTAARTSLFSSYPALIASVDDYYQLNSGLVVMETTNGITNNDLYRRVTPRSVLSWIRTVVANRMAASAQEWVQIFSKQNSGTYNNQWIVVNYATFVPGQPLPDNTLWVAEQIPGYIEAADVTKYLRLGYWPSFNVPFFEKIFNESGFVDMERQYGPWFTYQMNPRALIFRRDADKVDDIAAARNFLRYNDWTVDPAAAGNPGNQISSRFDLVPVNVNPPNPYLARGAFGGVDSKVTSYALLQSGLCHAQSGPTHDNVAPFQWNDKDWPGIVHVGQPQVWNFGWIEMPTGRVVS